MKDYQIILLGFTLGVYVLVFMGFAQLTQYGY